MVRRILSALSLVLVVACVSSRAPMFSFGPSDGPLRYQIDAYASLLVETPDGNQSSKDTVRSTVVLEVGDETAAGRSVIAQFETIALKTVGDMGNRQVEGTELVGKRYMGTLKQDGTIEVGDAPETPRRLKDLIDPPALLAELMVPLPPEANADAESWPVESVVTSRAGMLITATYKGTARFAGDTTWNGRPARIIASDGTMELQGRGMPPGAPGEIEMTLSGQSSRRYVWDASRGVMFAAVNESDASGVIVVLDFDIAVPTSVSNLQRVELQM